MKNKNKIKISFYGLKLNISDESIKTIIELLEAIHLLYSILEQVQDK